MARRPAPVSPGNAQSLVAQGFAKSDRHFNGLAG